MTRTNIIVDTSIINREQLTKKSLAQPKNATLPNTANKIISISIKSPKDDFQTKKGKSTNLTNTNTTHVDTNTTSFNRRYNPSRIKPYTRKL